MVCTLTNSKLKIPNQKLKINKTQSAYKNLCSLSDSCLSGDHEKQKATAKICMKVFIFYFYHSLAF